jgi:hypothetical protein
MPRLRRNRIDLRRYLLRPSPLIAFCSPGYPRLRLFRPSLLTFSLILLCGSFGPNALPLAAQDPRSKIVPVEQPLDTNSTDSTFASDQAGQQTDPGSSQSNSQSGKKESRGAIIVAPIPISSPAIGSGAFLAGGYIQIPTRATQENSPEKRRRLAVSLRWSFLERLSPNGYKYRTPQESLLALSRRLCGDRFSVVKSCETRKSVTWVLGQKCPLTCSRSAKILRPAARSGLQSSVSRPDPVDLVGLFSKHQSYRNNSVPNQRHALCWGLATMRAVKYTPQGEVLGSVLELMLGPRSHEQEVA